MTPEQFREIEVKAAGMREHWAWIPTKPDNPTKLQAHKLVKGKWEPLSIVKFVPDA